MIMSYYINNYRDSKLYVRELQDHGRTGEALLWYSYLKTKEKDGYIFRRQYQLGDTKVDFFCKKLNLIIEINRNTRFTNLDPAKNKRIGELKIMGFIVLSYSESEIIYHLNEVVEQIRDTVAILEKNIK